MTEDNLDSFERAFSTQSGSCRMVCNCGRQFFDNHNSGWTWEEGEFEKLLADETATALNYAVGSIMFEGREYVNDCDCWRKRARQLVAFIDGHAREIAEWHSRLPNIGNSHFRVCYGAECNNIIYAVAAWSNPVARLLPQQTWLELRRFAIAPDAPRYTASRMLGWMRRNIIERFPEVVRLISYQDLDAHSGTIYMASGWKQAENFKPRARGWIGWGNRPRKGRTNQAVAPRMRWEYDLTRSQP